MIFPNWAPNFPFTKRSCFLSHLWIFWQRELSSNNEVLNGSDAKEQQKEPGALLWLPCPVLQLLVLHLAPSFPVLPPSLAVGAELAWGVGRTGNELHFNSFWVATAFKTWAKLPPYRSRVLQSGVGRDIMRQACTAALQEGWSHRITPWCRMRP